MKQIYNHLPKRFVLVCRISCKDLKSMLCQVNYRVPNMKFLREKLPVTHTSACTSSQITAELILHCIMSVIWFNYHTVNRSNTLDIWCICLICINNAFVITGKSVAQFFLFFSVLFIVFHVISWLGWRAEEWRCIV